MPRALRTYGQPRYTDAYSFNGRGRLQIQYVKESPLGLSTNPPILVPDGAPRPVDVGPGEPRG